MGGGGDQWEAWNWSCDLRANERPRKKLHQMAHKTRLTNSMTESAQRGRFSENRFKYLRIVYIWDFLWKKMFWSCILNTLVLWPGMNPVQRLYNIIYPIYYIVLYWSHICGVVHHSAVQHQREAADKRLLCPVYRINLVSRVISS